MLIIQGEGFDAYVRAGEMIGLKWSDVDFKNKIVYIRRTLRYDTYARKWVTGDPKSISGVREIPLTQEAVALLKNQKEKNQYLKVIPIEYSDLVFLDSKGKPRSNTSYDIKMQNLWKSAGMPTNISMHILRHTFATRCIEAGMKPKTLQMILGHSNLAMTMDLYVHVTGEEKVKEMETVENGLKIV